MSIHFLYIFREIHGIDNHITKLYSPVWEYIKEAQVNTLYHKSYVKSLYLAKYNSPAYFY